MKKNRAKGKNGSVPAAAPEPVAQAAAPAVAAAPAKQAAPAPPAPTPAKQPASVAIASAEPSNGIRTLIEAKVDVGFGNQLYIRGGGAGLSWSEGTPLECEDPSTWIWQGANISEPFEFKLLINDQNWCIGANYTAQPGATMQVIPHFC